MKRALFILLAALTLFTTAASCSAVYGEGCDVDSIPEVAADAAYVVELTTGTVLYSKKSTERMYPASTTKLMTALIAAEQIEAGRISTGDVITFSYDAVFGIPRDTMHISIEVGEELTVLQVLYAMLLPSANEACLGMAEHIAGSVPDFITMMNTRAEELGMTDTHFVTANGLHDADHYMSPADLATLLKEAMSHELLRGIMSTPTYEIPPTNKTATTRRLTNTNKLILPDSGYENPLVIGGKTGYTTPAGNTLATLSEYNGMRFIVVLMKAAQGTTFNDTSALVNYFAANLRLEKVTATIDYSVSIPTADGGALLAEPGSELTVLMHTNDSLASYRKEYTLPGEITVPVAAGEKLGALRIYDGETLVCTVPMLARNDWGVAITEPTVTATGTTQPGETTGTGETSGGAVSNVTSAPATSVTSATEAESGGSFFTVLLKFLLAVLCLVILCAIAYAVLLAVSAWRHGKKRKLPPQKTPDAESTYTMANILDSAPQSGAENGKGPEEK